MIAKVMRYLSLMLITLYAFSCCIVREGNANNGAQDITANPKHFELHDITPMLSQIEHIHGRIIIKQHYDLHGKEIILNDGCTLVFKGGSFSNGSVCGNNTKIIFKDGAIFDNVRIKGSWVVKDITTDLFRDLRYVNSLADVIALTNGNVDNRVVIKDYGYDYPVKVSSIGVYEAPLKIKSNTVIRLDGTIRLLENNLFQYRIMLLNSCRNVKIGGNGSIKGDRPTHDYSIDEGHKGWKSHEWGHGITISNCKNIEISGISVNDCTGDSFNVGDNSKKILLCGVTAKGSRRQGVTIAVASDVTIDKCHFYNIGKDNGTAPGAAIDVEPNNAECVVKNIQIKSCEIKNCRHGIVSYSKGYGTTWTENVNGEAVVMRDGRHYVNIQVKSCLITGVHDAFSLIGWDKGIIKDCQVSDVDLFLRFPKNLTVEDNVIACKYIIPPNTLFENCKISKNKIKLRSNAELMLKKSTWRNNLSYDSRIYIRVEDL